LIEII